MTNDDESSTNSTAPIAGGSHAVHFYERDDDLVNRVASFIAAGLRAGDAAVVIATEAHRELLLRRLDGMDIQVEAHRLAGKLTILDAAETLARFMDGDVPDRDLFRRVVGGVVASSSTRGNETVNVRAYGEMVDLLWRGGNPRGALALEELWNDLAGAHRFDLLCGYYAAAFQNAIGGLKDVCDRHTDVVVADGPHVESTPALAAEIAYRKQAEQALRTAVGELRAAAAREREWEARSRQLADELRDTVRINELARAQEAIRLRDEFLALAAHELRTPLTVLQLQLDTLNSRVDESRQRLAAKLHRANQSSEKLATLIETLLDVSRIASGSFDLDIDEVDFVGCVERVVDGLRPSADNARCGLTVDARGPIVGTWDRLRLEQALTNLLANAIKYGAGKPIAVSVRRQGGEVVLQVRDHGPGIPETALGRLFRRFERAAPMRNYGGLGLGLYFIQAIVDAHGGSVTVQNMPDGGACFQITLPLRKVIAPVEITTTTQPADVN